MRFVVLNLAAETTRMLQTRVHLAQKFPDVEVVRFEASDTIPASYARLQQEGVGWGLDTIVMQDDVRFVKKFDSNPVFIGLDAVKKTPALIVYGFMRRGGHVCPKAFAATSEMWERLAVWDGTPGPGRNGRGIICPAWKPLVEQFGIVLNNANSPLPPRPQIRTRLGL